MASINSIMGGGGSTSGIFGNRNVISGLASGMDTESMIENAVSGYKLKIAMIQQQRTSVEWQQTAYRNIIAKMAAFSEKYASFSSGTNVSSAGFFDGAVKVISQGANADKISASGKSSSDIQIESVEQLASSARYSVSASSLAASNVASGSFNLTDTVKSGSLSGSMTLGYGGKTVRVRFSEADVYESAQAMAEGINKKLADETIAFNSGKQSKASEVIRAVADGDQIRFETVSKDDGNGVWIDSADAGLESAFGIKTEGDERDLKSFGFAADKMFTEKTAVDLLAEKGFTMVVDGVSKTVKGPTQAELGAGWNSDTYMAKLQEKIDAEFGVDSMGSHKLTVSNAAKDGSVQFAFTAHKDTKFSVSTDAGEQVGMDAALTSYVNMHKKVGDLLAGADWDSWRIQADGAVTQSADGKTATDAKGNRVAKGADNQYYRVDEKGEFLYDLRMNNKSVGTVTKDSTLQQVMDTISSSKEVGIKASYSEFTDKFTFTAKQSGADQHVSFDQGGLGAALFGGGVETDGKNAIFSVSVNGEPARTVERGSNNVDIDGMKITLKGEFSKDTEAVTFRTESDADKIINVVRDLVKDYNDMAKTIKDAYSTMPETDSKGKPFKPLTDKDREDMSENEIKNYEERAKKGILFADRDLSNLYTGLQNALGVLGIRGNDAKKLGITTTFENNTTTISLDESQLRKALEQDPDQVKKVFTASKENGDGYDGLMVGLKTQLDRYAKTTGAVKGLLVGKAGSPLAPTSVMQNEMQKDISRFDQQIAQWQDKLADKIDYYNSKFTALETLIAEMNNQSGMLMGLGGGF